MRNVILLLTLFIPFTGIAQDIFPDETVHQKWEYVTWYFWGGQCEKRIIVNGDKVELCGKSYIQVFDCNQNETDCRLIGYYRIRNDSVLIRTSELAWNGSTPYDTVYCDKPEGLMFDFGIAAPDTLICQINSTHPPTLTRFWKTQEQVVNYEGIDRQTLTMGFLPHPASPFNTQQMKWISGIGSNIHPLYSFTCIGGHCEWEQQLTKVFRNETLLYQDTVLSFSFACTSWISPTKEITFDNPGPALYPNPATTSFTIQSGNALPETLPLKVLDMLGHTVLDLPAHPVKESIQVAFLPAGLYYVQIPVGKRNTFVKLIKM